MSKKLFVLNREGNVSLRDQLRRQILQAISSGHLSVGTELPSIRNLARDASISRNTVAVAYDSLVAEGVLICQPRVGYRVSGLAQHFGKAAIFIDGANANVKEAENARNRESEIRQTPSTYCLQPVMNDARFFPFNAWRNATSRSLAKAEMPEWNREFDSSDDPFLVEQLRSVILPRRGLWVEPNEILVTTGTQNANYLLSRVLRREHNTIGIENPTSPKAMIVFTRNQIRVRPLQLDDQGLMVSDQLKGCSLLFTTPTVQIPTGRRMSPARMQALADWAEESNATILEYDGLSEINFCRHETPCLKSFDKAGKVIYVSGFNVVLGPGVRLAYIVARPEIIQSLRLERDLILRNLPRNNERALAHYIASGQFHSSILRAREIYGERLRIMSNALEKQFPGAAKTQPTGGFFYWFEGPPGVDSIKACKDLKEFGVDLEPGTPSFVEGTPRNFFRASFSSIEASMIPDAVEIIGRYLWSPS